MASALAIGADESIFLAGAAVGVYAKASGKSAARMRAEKAGWNVFMGERS